MLRKYYISLVLVLFFVIFNFAHAAASDHFVIKVNITDPDDATFTIPTFPGETYNYSVDWDNNQVFEDTGNTSDATYDFGSTGIKTIRISGAFPRIYFNNSGDKEKIVEVSQWGTNVWKSMERAFYGATNLLITATDAPNLSSVGSMAYMFADADGLMENVGTFERWINYSGAGTNPRFTKAADLNADGYDDIVVSASGELRVFLNNGDRTFTLDEIYDHSTGNVGFDLGDIDGDGDLDIVWAARDVLVVYKNNGNGKFTLHGEFLLASASNLNHLYLSDIDNDGDLDIVGVSYSDGFIIVFLNDGDGSFNSFFEREIVNHMGFVQLGDLDGDGYNDIVTASWAYTTVFVMMNNQDGTFADPVEYGPPHTAGSYVRGISLADMDLDGDLDIVATILVSGNTTPISVIMNNGDGAFANPSVYAVSSPYYTTRIKTGDLNHDGFPDVVVGQSSGNRVTVLLNDGDGTLESAINYTVSGSNESVDIADFDKDGVLDILAASNNGTFSILYNKSSGLHRWNTSSVTDMSHMFDGADGFNQSVATWDISSVENMSSMFNGVTLSTETYDWMLMEWLKNNPPHGVVFDAGNSKYCSGINARNSLQNDYGWIITDGGYDTAYNEEFGCIKEILPSKGSGGQSTEVNASCSVSDTTIRTGEEVDIEIDVEVKRKGSIIPYTFRWTKILSGKDTETSHAFDKPGEYKIQGQISTQYVTKTVTCDTITVSDKKSSSSAKDEDKSEDESKEESEPVSQSLLEIVSKYKDFLLTLRSLGINLSVEVNKLLSNETISTLENTPTFTRDLELGDSHKEVRLLQQFLNSNGYIVTETGPGSVGLETEMFGYATRDAVIRFQQANNISPAVGYFGPVTRNFVNSL